LIRNLSIEETLLHYVPASLIQQNPTGQLGAQNPRKATRARFSTDTETLPLEQAETKTGTPVIETERLADFTTGDKKEKS
jgi:hypothetical protein